MKIQIENLGAVKKAEIDLSKRFTVFCGPNHSGKTYSAFLIYALTESFHYVPFGKARDIDIQELLQKREIIVTVDVLRISKYRSLCIQEVKNSLDSIFGISPDVAEKLFKDLTLKIQPEENLEEEYLSMCLEHTLKVDTTNIAITKKVKERHIKLTILGNFGFLSEDKAEHFQFVLSAAIYKLTTLYPLVSSHILPLERNSIYTFSKELSIQKHDFLDTAQSLASKDKKDLSSLSDLIRSSTRYPLPIRNGLKIAEDLRDLSKTKTKFLKLAEEIETQLLHGKVVVGKNDAVQFVPSKAKTKQLPIHLTASIVKTLSSLVFYLKHLAKNNELILIDEPELTLHPDNQVYLARIFAKLINNGLRLLISTHSDYIIREINNLIMLSSPKEEVNNLRAKFGYGAAEKIDPKDINVYLFNFKNKTSRRVTAFPIEITRHGFEMKTMNKTIDKLNKVSEDLFYAIE